MWIVDLSLVSFTNGTLMTWYCNLLQAIYVAFERAYKCTFAFSEWTLSVSIHPFVVVVVVVFIIVVVCVLVCLKIIEPWHKGIFNIYSYQPNYTLIHHKNWICAFVTRYWISCARKQKRKIKERERKRERLKRLDCSDCSLFLRSPCCL